MARMPGGRRLSLNTLTALDTVSAQQRQAQTGDAVGVFLIGVLMSSGGDKEGAVAQHKGELIAISFTHDRRPL
jgi:hypothetical protein